MAIVTLLVLPTTPRDRLAFVFEHDQAHRRSPSKVAYLLDPMQNEGIPGTKWHLDHQQAHNGLATGPPPEINSPIQDSNLMGRKMKPWWEFFNHQEHYLRP